MRKGVQHMTILVVLILLLMVGAIFFAATADTSNNALEGLADLVGITMEKSNAIGDRIGKSFVEGIQHAKNTENPLMNGGGAGSGGLPSGKFGCDD